MSEPQSESTTGQGRDAQVDTSVPATSEHVAPTLVTKPETAGCFPAVLAATLLMGIVMFVLFGFAGYLIFQKRGDLAARTLRGSMLPEIEQSRLDPATKQLVIQRLSKVATDIDNKLYENWQAGGIMNRLVRSPLLRWGDLLAVDAWAAENLPEAERDNFHEQVTRFLRAAELDRALAMDLQDVLSTVTLNDPASILGRLKEELVITDVREVAVRAKIVADRAKVPDQVFEGISLPAIVERLIESGVREGST